MGKQLLQGRAFNDHDTPSSPRVAVVNQTFVHKFFKSENPLGRTLRTLAEPNYPATGYQIVGIVKDAKYADLREDVPPEVFGSAQQFGVRARLNVFIRSSSPASAAISAVRRKLSEISPEIRTDFRVFETDVHDGLVRERLMAILSGFFGALAALLAAVGLYGVTSYSVAARTNEIGIRLAMGATRRVITASIMRRAGYLAGIGITLGGILALASARVASSLLFGLQATDRLTFLGAIAFLIVVACVASWVPARRAARCDPATVLRYE
jgi:predicted lysophospholipase L1 biosynthesis ABC-type transport system permease subunit